MIMKNIKLEKIVLGDFLGVIAPSRHVYGNNKNINKGINALKRLGFRIKLADHFKSRQNISAGSKYERVTDINSMFADKDIKAIFCAIGGHTTNQILDLLDYELINKNPKPIMGFSDITNLIMAINTKTNIITFHGLNLNLLSSLSKSSIKQTVDLLQNKKTNFNYFTECKVIKSGIAEGKLLGGNLFVINALNKTNFAPNFEESILFWEDIDGGLNSIDYQIYQLHISGILAKIKGMIIGHIYRQRNKDSKLLRETLLELTRRYNYPILKMNSFGHGVRRFITFPIGIKARINTENKFFGWEEKIFK